MTNDEIGEILGPMFPHIAHDGALALKDLGLPAGAAVLDVGTGAGKFAIFLALQGHDVLTGEPETDTSHYAGKDWADNAEKAGVREKIRFQAFDASQMPFADGAFNAVFFFGVLHHVDEGARPDVLSEALRVAGSGGAVVFFEPRPETLERIWVNDPGHPMAADPSDYLTDETVRQQKIEGQMMNIYIYRNAA
jgi:ubiquinone/menaquinone biosynthesis C-methylase UbiE